MALLSCRDLVLHFGDRALLDGASLQIQERERIGLVGRNGEGKSSLLKILQGTLEPEGGDVVRPPGLRVSSLPQQVPAQVEGTVAEVLRSGFPREGAEEFQVDRLCSILELGATDDFASLSGGQKRRALLGRALAADPEVLLLDEPTNHLDLDGIQWLEEFLLRFPGSLLFVTHDRTFLQRLATRIVELDRGKLTSWECDYATFTRRRDAELDNQERRWALQDEELAREESWIRQGIKARRRRNQGRVRALQALRTRRAQRRERVGPVRMSIQESERSGFRVIEARGLGFDFGESPIVKDLTTTIYRGDKVGIVGPNGCGKTTLLKLFLKELRPSTGTVRHGISLQVSHFDQHRETLDDSWTVAGSVERGSDFLTIDGKKKHVLGYLQDFLFPRERAQEPVSSLSGGERNRLLLARLFARPANLLVLDEPTNDLDVETLELLEAKLLEFPGTVLVVSHDRSFLDNLCTNTLVFEGEGRVKEYVGGYSDWRRVVESREGAKTARTEKRGGSRRKSKDWEGDEEKGPRLTYREKEEWQGLPERIEALERELRELHRTMARPEFYQRDAGEIREASSRGERLEADIEAAYHRWEELEQKAKRSGEA